MREVVVSISLIFRTFDLPPTLCRFLCALVCMTSLLVAVVVTPYTEQLTVVLTVCAALP